MELQQTGVVREVYGERAANELIGAGWLLLAVVSGYNHQQGTAAPCYVLGRQASTPSQLPEGGGFQQNVG